VPVTIGHNPPVLAFFFFSPTPNPFFKKKTLVLTLGSPLEKGGEKKQKPWY
jgi:hypothetical protein